MATLLSESTQGQQQYIGPPISTCYQHVVDQSIPYATRQYPLRFSESIEHTL